MDKYLLFAPGPVNVAQTLRHTICKEDICHHHKVLAFNEGVFIFLLSAGLIFDQLAPTLWILAASPVFWGTYKSCQRGKNIGAITCFPSRNRTHHR